MSNNFTLPEVVPESLPLTSSSLLLALQHWRNIFTLMVTLWIVDVVYKCTLHPLSKAPGPWLAKFSQSWRNFRYFRGSWHDDIIALHRKYGSVVRIAPNEISFVDVAALKELYGHGKQVLKTKWYDSFIIPNMTVSFFAATDIKVHRHIRSRVSGAYSMSAVLAMEPLIQEVADDSWQELGKLADKGTPVPMHQWGNYFAFDVVGQLAMGGKLGFIKQGKDIGGIINSVHNGVALMGKMGYMPLQMFWFNNSVSQWVVKQIGGKRLNAFTVFLNWLEERVDERLRNGLGDKRRDMLQHFVEAKDVSGAPVKKGDVMIEGANIIGAGAGTTAIGILAVLGSLLRHPAELDRLQKEIDQAYSDLGLQKDQELSFKDAENLPYLSAVFKESTRLHPSIQYQLPRYAPQGGIQIGEHRFEGGTICGISPASMNRSKEIFGDDADEWKPERWIARDEEEEEATKVRKTLLTTFGMGSRSCIGRNLATVETYMYIAQFVRHFNATLVNPARPWVTTTHWFSLQSDFWIDIQRRDHSIMSQNEARNQTAAPLAPS